MNRDFHAVCSQPLFKVKLLWQEKAYRLIQSERSSQELELLSLLVTTLIPKLHAHPIKPLS